MAILTGVIGLLGAVLGATLSYVFGARAQREAARREVFNRALQSVALMRAAASMPADLVGTHLDEEDSARLNRELIIAGAQRHTAAMFDARDARAALVPYWSDAQQYPEPWLLDDEQLGGLLTTIRNVRDRNAPGTTIQP